MNSEAAIVNVDSIFESRTILKCLAYYYFPSTFRADYKAFIPAVLHVFCQKLELYQIGYDRDPCSSNESFIRQSYEESNINCSTDSLQSLGNGPITNSLTDRVTFSKMMHPVFITSQSLPNPGVGVECFHIGKAILEHVSDITHHQEKRLPNHSNVETSDVMNIQSSLIPQVDNEHSLLASTLKLDPKLCKINLNSIITWVNQSGMITLFRYNSDLNCLQPLSFHHFNTTHCLNPFVEITLNNQKTSSNTLNVPKNNFRPIIRCCIGRPRISVNYVKTGKHSNFHRTHKQYDGSHMNGIDHQDIQSDPHHEISKFGTHNKQTVTNGQSIVIPVITSCPFIIAIQYQVDCIGFLPLVVCSPGEGVLSKRIIDTHSIDETNETPLFGQHHITESQELDWLSPPWFLSITEDLHFFEIIDFHFIKSFHSSSDFDAILCILGTSCPSTESTIRWYSDTTFLLTLQLNMLEKTFTILSKSRYLPSSSFSILPLELPFLTSQSYIVPKVRHYVLILSSHQLVVLSPFNDESILDSQIISSMSNHQKNSKDNIIEDIVQITHSETLYGESIRDILRCVCPSIPEKDSELLYYPDRPEYHVVSGVSPNQFIFEQPLIDSSTINIRLTEFHWVSVSSVCHILIPKNAGVSWWNASLLRHVNGKLYGFQFTIIPLSDTWTSLTVADSSPDILFSRFESQFVQQRYQENMLVLPGHPVLGYPASLWEMTLINNDSSYTQTNAEEAAAEGAAACVPDLRIQKGLLNGIEQRGIHLTGTVMSSITVQHFYKLLKSHWSPDLNIPEQGVLLCIEANQQDVARTEHHASSPLRVSMNQAIPNDNVYALSSINDTETLLSNLHNISDTNFQTPKTLSNDGSQLNDKPENILILTGMKDRQSHLLWSLIFSISPLSILTGSINLGFPRAAINMNSDSNGDQLPTVACITGIGTETRLIAVQPSIKHQSMILDSSLFNAPSISTNISSITRDPIEKERHKFNITGLESAMYLWILPLMKTDVSPSVTNNLSTIETNHDINSGDININDEPPAKRLRHQHLFSTTQCTEEPETDCCIQLNDQCTEFKRNLKHNKKYLIIIGSDLSIDIGRSYVLDFCLVDKSVSQPNSFKEYVPSFTLRIIDNDDDTIGFDTESATVGCGVMYVPSVNTEHHSKQYSNATTARESQDILMLIQVTTTEIRCISSYDGKTLLFPPINLLELSDSNQEENLTHPYTNSLKDEQMGDSHLSPMLQSSTHLSNTNVLVESPIAIQAIIEEDFIIILFENNHLRVWKIVSQLEDTLDNTHYCYNNIMIPLNTEFKILFKGYNYYIIEIFIKTCPQILQEPVSSISTCSFPTYNHLIVPSVMNQHQRFTHAYLLIVPLNCVYQFYIVNLSLMTIVFFRPSLSVSVDDIMKNVPLPLSVAYSSHSKLSMNPTTSRLSHYHPITSSPTVSYLSQSLFNQSTNLQQTYQQESPIIRDDLLSVSKFPYKIHPKTSSIIAIKMYWIDPDDLGPTLIVYVHNSPLLIYRSFSSNHCKNNEPFSESHITFPFRFQLHTRCMTLPSLSFDPFTTVPPTESHPLSSNQETFFDQISTNRSLIFGQPGIYIKKKQQYKTTWDPYTPTQSSSTIMSQMESLNKTSSESIIILQIPTMNDQGYRSTLLYFLAAHQNVLYIHYDSAQLSDLTNNTSLQQFAISNPITLTHTDSFFNGKWLSLLSNGTIQIRQLSSDIKCIPPNLCRLWAPRPTAQIYLRMDYCVKADYDESTGLLACVSLPWTGLSSVINTDQTNILDADSSLSVTHTHSGSKRQYPLSTVPSDSHLLLFDLKSIDSNNVTINQLNNRMYLNSICQFKFPSSDRVTEVKFVALGGLSYIATGSAVTLESVADDTLGRLYLFDLPSTQNSTLKHISLRFSNLYTSPVMYIGVLNLPLPKDPMSSKTKTSFLLHSAGRKLFVNEFERDELVRGSFFDFPCCVLCVATIKSYLLIGDALTGPHFIMFRVNKENRLATRSLYRLSRANPSHIIPGSLAAVAVEYISSGSSLHLLAATSTGALQIYEYSATTLPSVPSQEGKNTIHNNVGSTSLINGIRHEHSINKTSTYLSLLATIQNIKGEGPINQLLRVRGLHTSKGLKQTGAVAITSYGGLHIVMPSS